MPRFVGNDILKAFTECRVCNYRYALTKRCHTREFALNFAKLVLRHFSEFFAETIAFLFVSGIGLDFVNAQFKLFWSFFAPTGARFAQLLTN